MEFFKKLKGELESLVETASEKSRQLYDSFLTYVARRLPEDKIKETEAYRDLKEERDGLNGRVTVAEQERVIALEQQTKLRETYIDLRAKLAAVGKKTAVIIAEYRDLIKSYDEIKIKERQKMIELATIRIGRGFPASYFNCPEAVGVIAKKNEELKERNANLETEVVSLKQKINSFTTLFYENVFDLASINNLIPKKDAALIFIDNTGKISRVSGGLSDLLDGSDRLIGSNFINLYSSIPDFKTRKNLFNDWKNVELKYREVIAPNGNKIDVLVQRLNYFEDDRNAGAFVYVARHKFLKLHKETSRLLKNLRGVEEELQGRLNNPILGSELS